MPCNVFSFPGVCEDGSYYDVDGKYYPSGGKLPFNYVPGDIFYNTCNPLYDKNCMDTTDYSIPVKGTTRPIINTNYIDPNTGLSVNPNVNQWSFASLFNPQNTAANNTASNVPATGIMGTIQAHPVLALGGAALLLYFFMGSGGGTYEQITTKRKGFGS